jgi:hypothetical protein
MGVEVKSLLKLFPILVVPLFSSAPALAQSNNASCLIVFKLEVINPQSSRATRDYRLDFSGENVPSVSIPDTGESISFRISGPDVKLHDIIGSLRGGLTGANNATNLFYALPYSPGQVVIANYVIQRTIKEISMLHYSDGVSLRKITARERRELWDKLQTRQDVAGWTLAEASPPMFESSGSGIKLARAVIDLAVGGRPFLLQAALGAEKGAPVAWSSSRPEVASVSPEGLVTGVAAGTALISAKTDSGSATCVAAVWQSDDQNFVRFRCDEPALYEWSFTDNPNPLDAWSLGGPPLSVMVEKVSGVKTQGFGMRFFQRDSQNFYQLLITTEGEYLLGKVVAGAFSLLVPWTPSSAILSGNAKINTLSISQLSEGSFAISINSSVVKTVNDSSFNRGTVSFFASIGSPYGESQENLPAEPVDIRFKIASPAASPAPTSP